jgi:hypothetical protein
MKSADPPLGVTTCQHEEPDDLECGIMQLTGSFHFLYVIWPPQLTEVFCMQRNI